MPKRRAKGEGSEWYDETTKQWRWRITHEGKKHVVSAADRTRAREERDRLKAELQRGAQVGQSSQSLAEWLAYWLEEVVRRAVKESTHADYRRRCELYIVPSIGHYAIDPTKLTPIIVRRWANATRDAYALSTARQALSILKRALAVAERDHVIPFNPAAGVTIAAPPRETDDTEQRDTRTLDADQLAALLDYVKAHDAHQQPYADKRYNQSAGMFVLYTLAARLGLRRGELLGLRKKDIDLEAKILRVRQQVIKIDNAHKISATLKTKAARRDLPLAADLVTLLRPHILRTTGDADALIFPATNAGPTHPDVVTKHFARVCKQIGLTGFVFHDLRATALTNWRTSGAPLEVVAAMAGHEKADVTADVYLDVSMERKRTALGE